jgi:hopanoid-associated phosphorylase
LSGSLLLVTGMQREARLFAPADIVIAGGDNTTLAAKIEAAAAHASAIMSIGIGGGLDDDLKPGAVVIAREIATADQRIVTDAPWHDALAAALPDSRSGIIAGSDTIIPTATAKALLRQQTNAQLVDMESHIAARVAAARNLPFAALRVVADDSRSALPEAALTAIGTDGEVKLTVVLRALARRPNQIPALMRAGRDAATAMAALRRASHLLGHRFACPYVG